MNNNFLILILSSQYFLIVNSIKTCEELLNSFSENTANFTSCTIANSRPITLCEDCVENYINVIESYENMSKFTENNIKCLDNYINLDRLQIIETTYRNSYDLWNRAKCDECFTFVNSKLTPIPSNETLKFDTLYLDLIKCVNVTNGTKPEELCQDCLDNYINLNNYYVSISDENEKIGVCMDIVDLMNTTRKYWSTKCCQYRKHNELIFISVSIGIFIVTALFYILTNFFGEKKIPAILQQSRFAESLNQVNKVNQESGSESNDTDT